MYANIRDIKEEDFPMTPCLVAKCQIKDKTLNRYINSNTKQEFKLKKIEGFDLTHCQGHIYVPKVLQAHIIAWYHEYLVHPGHT